MDVINAFKNTNVKIYEIVCVIPPPYDLDWFKKSYPSIPFNRYDRKCFMGFLNGIQVTKLPGIHRNILLDTVFESEIK